MFHSLLLCVRSAEVTGGHVTQPFCLKPTRQHVRWNVSAAKPRPADLSHSARDSNYHSVNWYAALHALCPVDTWHDETAVTVLCIAVTRVIIKQHLLSKSLQLET